MKHKPLPLDCHNKDTSHNPRVLPPLVWSLFQDVLGIPGAGGREGGGAFLIFLDGNLQPYALTALTIYSLYHSINHLSKEPKGAFDRLMAAAGQRSLMDAAAPRH